MSSEGATVRSFRDLIVWKMGIGVTRRVYALVSQLPSEEKFILAQQMCRAAVSIPSNIAEGHARGATRDFARFISMARGSLAEIETQIELCVQLGYFSAEDVAELLVACAELGRAMTGLRKSLDSRLAVAHKRAP